MTALGLGLGVPFKRRSGGAAAPPPPALVRSDTNAGAVSITPGVTPINGNTIFLMASAPVDSAGWTWPSGFTMRLTGTGGGWYWGIAEKVAASESGAYTMAGTFAASNATLCLGEFSGIKTSTPYDVGNPQGSPGAIQLIYTTAATAQAVSLAIGGTFYANGVSSITWTNGFTKMQETGNISFVYKVLSATGVVTTQNDWVTNRSCAGGIGVWKGT